ncbi:MAG: hypothetical protein B0D92_00670, partial [Spirochaeta sp. LUC14_002_19_P3]
MDKKTILAIILTSVIITAGMLLTQYVNERNAPPPTASSYSVPEEVTETPAAEPEASIQVEETVPDPAVSELPEQNFEKKHIEEETNLFRIVFSSIGGVVLDIDLLTEFDKSEPISMVLDGDTDSGTFNLAFGGSDAPYIRDVFEHQRIQRGKQIIHNFSRKYHKEGRNFTLTKSYRIIPDEYLIE